MTKPRAESLTPAEAAKSLGVSYPTIKQWIYRKRIRSVPLKNHDILLV